MAIQLAGSFEVTEPRFRLGQPAQGIRQLTLEDVAVGLPGQAGPAELDRLVEVALGPLGVVDLLHGDVAELALWGPNQIDLHILVGLARLMLSFVMISSAWRNCCDRSP